MICKDQHDDDLLSVNIGRPSFFDDNAIRLWRDFHNWIIDTDIPIFVNGFFWTAKEMLDKNEKYGGNGFQYRFWFKNEDDRRAFEAKVAELDREFATLAAERELSRKYTGGR